jgi:hypothetical protein
LPIHVPFQDLSVRLPAFVWAGPQGVKGRKMSTTTRKNNKAGLLHAMMTSFQTSSANDAENQ